VPDQVWEGVAGKGGRPAFSQRTAGRPDSGRAGGWPGHRCMAGRPPALRGGTAELRRRATRDGVGCFSEVARGGPASPRLGGSLALTRGAWKSSRLSQANNRRNRRAPIRTSAMEDLPLEALASALLERPPTDYSKPLLPESWLAGLDSDTWARPASSSKVSDRSCATPLSARTKSCSEASRPCSTPLSARGELLRRGAPSSRPSSTTLSESTRGSRPSSTPLSASARGSRPSTVAAFHAVHDSTLHSNPATDPGGSAVSESVWSEVTASEHPAVEPRGRLPSGPDQEAAPAPLPRAGVSGRASSASARSMTPEAAWHLKPGYHQWRPQWTLARH